MITTTLIKIRTRIGNKIEIFWNPCSEGQHHFKIQSTLFESTRLVSTVLVLMALSLSACGPFYHDNIYGQGHYSTEVDLNLSNPSSPDSDDRDHQALQAQFMTISVSQVSYQVTPTLSYILLRGTCFNPGFAESGIYFETFDEQGLSIAGDGLPYATNKTPDPKTGVLQRSNIVCDASGRWGTYLALPTAILQQLNRGQIQISLVVWHRGQALINESSGTATVFLTPPSLTPLNEFSF